LERTKVEKAGGLNAVHRERPVGGSLSRASLLGTCSLNM
jgi:hypothetical protein